MLINSNIATFNLEYLILVMLLVSNTVIMFIVANICYIYSSIGRFCEIPGGRRGVQQNAADSLASDGGQFDDFTEAVCQLCCRRPRTYAVRDWRHRCAGSHEGNV